MRKLTVGSSDQNFAQRLGSPGKGALSIIYSLWLSGKISGELQRCDH
ncbi:hypothetical protein [Allocoleopsis sp.]